MLYRHKSPSDSHRSKPESPFSSRDDQLSNMGSDSTGSSDNEPSTTYEPISGPQMREQNSQQLSVQRTQSRSSSFINNPCSCSLSDGYSRTDADDEGDIERAEQGTDTEQEAQFLVKWDGDHDPMNPRNMSLWRRWVIVAVISMGSACV